MFGSITADITDEDELAMGLPTRRHGGRQVLGAGGRFSRQDRKHRHIVGRVVAASSRAIRIPVLPDQTES